MQSPEKHGLYDPALEKDSCGIGFVAHIKGTPSHAIVENAITMLENMDHRGACGCEVNTGDGAGLLAAMPHAFLAKVAKRDAGIDLPRPGQYACGMIFLPSDPAYRAVCKFILERFVGEQGQRLLGWRSVPADNRALGAIARSTEPVVEQLFIAAADDLDRDAFERALFLIRKQAYHTIHASAQEQMGFYYVCSLSAKVLVYKGQLTSRQLRGYYPDLADPDFASHLAMVHSRFSTNTFPSWDRAQPMRYMSHNGEINTLRGNVNWMKARQRMMVSRVFGSEFHKAFPLIDPITSDSGMFDNVLELLMLSGRRLPHVMTMMIPEAWQNHDLMDPQRKAYYEFHSCLMEPWDGPASIAFTDGQYVGATLDRNGLRPSRYYVTHDDLVIMASEVGVLPVDPRNVRLKGRLQPGRMFLVDFQQGRIIEDEELKAQLAAEHPYAQWIEEGRITFEDLPAPPARKVPGLDKQRLLTRLQCLGYTHEDIHKLLVPMATDGQEAVGSMGNDAALAVLSDQPRMLYDYFKQMFAQVTNPPIDPIREELVMSLETYIGPEGNVLEASPEHARRLRLPQSILNNAQLVQLKEMDFRGWKSMVIDATFARPANGIEGERSSDPEPDGASTTRQGIKGTGVKTAREARANLVGALDRICAQATEGIEQGFSLVILSDRGLGEGRVAVPSLLAVGALHHHLVREGLRTRVGIIVETGEAREVHHHALLIGYGADAINPYLAFEALWGMVRDGTLNPRKFNEEKVTANYVKACGKGILKVMSKMGISTLQSYKGAQIFEAVGLNAEVMDRCFTATASRVAGIGFEALAQEAVRRHQIGYPLRQAAARLQVLPSGGQYQWRQGGESHMLDPQTIAFLQHAARSNSRQAYQAYAQYVDQHSTRACTLRGLFRLRTLASTGGHPIPIDEVEPAQDIVKRFCTGAMSLGAISPEAHETLAIAMNRLGGKSNTGEGGEDPKRYAPDPDGSLRRSAIKQVASARFGVTINYLTNADQLQIKMAQGAKPGEGGQLPGHKVDKYIGWLRHSTPGVTLISPPPHHDIYSIEDLAQLIYDLKNANPDARVSVKLVAETGVGTVAAGVAKAHADHILIAGHDGGTGASPLSSLKHAGTPWEIGLAEAHQTLVLNDLRSRVSLEVDGQLKTGRDVVIAAMLGAEEFGFSTAPLISVGCIMMRVCHLNTCPVGIATQDPELRRKFAGKPEHVINFFFLLAEDVRRHMAELGLRRFEDLVGRSDLLEMDEAIRHWKAAGLDLTPVLMPARKPRPDVRVTHCVAQEHGLEAALDHTLIKMANRALERREPVRLTLPIRNVNRTVGTMLSHQIARRYGQEGLAEGTIHVKLSGSAGQSFGAWLARGVTLELEGDANDYVAKGLSGGRVIVYPPRDALAAGFVAEKNILVGNVVLYGATSGQAFFRGLAGERFAVRNSGATTVVEGVGDHGCEYMTNGRVVVLGPTGRNFAAGMSGGIAYLYDPQERLPQRCNTDMVELEQVEDALDAAELRQIIELHAELTESPVARAILDDWDRQLPRFVKVMPSDYKRALAELAEESHYAASANDGEPSDLPGGQHVPEEEPTQAG